MSLVGYENVRPWVRAIRQRVLARQMPPWTADPAASVAFENDPSLSQAEIDRIVRWIDAGAPRGDGAEPAPPTLAHGWSDPSGREPDYVLTLPVAYTVPASNASASAGVLNPTFYAKVPFDDDRWIRAVQARPDQRSVVHYMDLNIVEFPDGAAPPGTVVPQMGAAAIGAGQEIDFLTANYRPGYGYEAFPAGSGRRLKGGRNRYSRSRCTTRRAAPRPMTDRRSASGSRRRLQPTRSSKCRSPPGSSPPTESLCSTVREPRWAPRCRRRCTTRPCRGTRRGSKSSASRPSPRR